MRFLEEAKKRISIGDIWYFGILGLFLLVMFEFGQGLEKNYREIVICVAIVIGLFVLLGLKMWTNIEFHQFAFVFIIVVGSLSLAIQPILNIPDEVAHFARAELVSRGNIIVDTSQTEYETIQSVIDMQENVKKTYISSNVKGEKINYSMAEIGHIAATNASFLYFPQAIGIMVAKFFKMDVIWMLWLARFCNLVCYALVIGTALKITPKLKSVLFLVATMPICMQQVASCSPDAIINASAILLIAYFVSLYCLEEKKITWKQVTIYFVLSVVVTICKVTNMFIAGLILLVPLGKFIHRKKAILIKCLIIGGVIALGGLYYIYTTLFPASPEHLAYLQAVNANSSGQIQYIIANFFEWIREFGISLINNFQDYVASLGSFGWLEYGNSLIPVVTVFLFGKICAKESGLYINKINKILLFLMIIGIYVATCLALYISWTPIGSTEILGVQGRYFIPMFALAALLFTSSAKDTITQQKNLGDMTAILSMNGAMLIATTLRYY